MPRGLWPRRVQNNPPTSSAFDETAKPENPNTNGADSNMPSSVPVPARPDAGHVGQDSTAPQAKPKAKPKWMTELESGAVYLSQYVDASQRQAKRLSANKRTAPQSELIPQNVLQTSSSDSLTPSSTDSNKSSESQSSTSSSKTSVKSESALAPIRLRPRNSRPVASSSESSLTAASRVFRANVAARRRALSHEMTVKRLKLDSAVSDSTTSLSSESGSDSGSDSESDSESDSGSDSGSDSSGSSDSSSVSRAKDKSGSRHVLSQENILKSNPLLQAMLTFMTPSQRNRRKHGSDSDSSDTSDSDSSNASDTDSDSDSDSDSSSESGSKKKEGASEVESIGPNSKKKLKLRLKLNGANGAKTAAGKTVSKAKSLSSLRKSSSPGSKQIPSPPPLPPTWWWKPEELLPLFSRFRPTQLNWDPRFIHSCDIPVRTVPRFGAPVFFEMPLPCGKEFFLACHETPTDLHNPLHEAAMVMDMWIIMLAKSAQHRAPIETIRIMYEDAVDNEDFVEFQKSILSFAMIAHQARPSLDFNLQIPSDMVHELISMTYRRIVSPYARSLNHGAKPGRYDRVYGELLSPILSKMFQVCELKKGDLFVDMGSGVGNVVLQAALETGANCVGCEIVERASILAQFQQQELEARTRAWGIDHQMGEVRFYLGDMTTCPPLLEALTQASVVMCNNKVFDNQLNARLVDLFRKHLRPGTKVISLEKFANDRAPVRAEKGIAVTEYPMPPGSCSWTEAGGRYFVTTFLQNEKPTAVNTVSAKRRVRNAAKKDVKLDRRRSRNR